MIIATSADLLCYVQRNACDDDTMGYGSKDWRF